ncbi:MAG: hypothetical protein OXH65_09465 [Paracoccaceae bacterium]|nr:hypothetical protein [Paracoccaceae bacterium]
MGKIQNNIDLKKVDRETIKRSNKKKKVNPESLISDKSFLKTYKERRTALVALAEK